jgi:hypothetical protein
MQRQFCSMKHVVPGPCWEDRDGRESPPRRSNNKICYLQEATIVTVVSGLAHASNQSVLRPRTTPPDSHALFVSKLTSLCMRCGLPDTLCVCTLDSYPLILVNTLSFYNIIKSGYDGVDGGAIFSSDNLCFLSVQYIRCIPVCRGTFLESDGLPLSPHAEPQHADNE